MTLIFYLTLFSKADLHGCEFLYLHIVILYLYIHTVDKVHNALMHPGSNGWKLKGCVSVVGQIQISLHLSKQISQLSLTFVSYFTMFCTWRVSGICRVQSCYCRFACLPNAETTLSNILGAQSHFSSCYQPNL